MKRGLGDVYKRQVYEAIRRMMPKGPLGRQMLTKVRIYRGAEHKHEAQKPEVLVLK